MPASKMTAHVFTSARQQVSACSLRPAAAAYRGRRLAGVGARQRQVTCSPAPCCPAPSDGAGTLGVRRTPQRRRGREQEGARRVRLVLAGWLGWPAPSHVYYLYELSRK